MSNLTDTKPVAVGGMVMRRTDSHVIDNSKVEVTKSGDQYIGAPKRNFALTTFPDSDPRWGQVSDGGAVPPEQEPDWEDNENWEDEEEWDE